MLKILLVLTVPERTLLLVLVKRTLLGSLPFLEKEFSLKLWFFIHEPEAIESKYQIFSIRGENEEGELVEGSLYLIEHNNTSRLKVGFPDINLDPGSTSQRLTNNPKFGKWILLKIQQEKETTKFMFRAWLNGEKQIQSKNQDVQIEHIFGCPQRALCRYVKLRG